MKNKNLGIFGIVLFAIGIVSLFINDFIDSDFLKKISEYGKFFSILGGAFIGVGFFGKKKTETNK
jgi:quinol-cytochrome oxidoreductase complex cytochrome b subunit